MGQSFLKQKVTIHFNEVQSNFSITKLNIAYLEMINSHFNNAFVLIPNPPQSLVCFQNKNNLILLNNQKKLEATSNKDNWQDTRIILTKFTDTRLRK